MRPLPLAAGLAAFVLLTAAARQSPPSPTAPQQPGLTFRATANYIELDAIVTDERGTIVRDLTAADFDVSEDGRPQALAVCSFIDIPIERAPIVPASPGDRMPAIEPDVVTNEKTFDGRVFMIVLDGYHVSALTTAAVRLNAGKFIDRYMGEHDIATVVHIGGQSAGQEFTSNKRLLRDAVSRFSGQALPSVTASLNRDAMLKNDEQWPGFYNPGPPRDADAPVREFMARESLDSLRRLSEYMAALGGRRKALLLFSEGTGLDMMPDITIAAGGQGLPLQGATLELRAAQRAMVAAAARGNVSIYSIDPRGLTSGMEESTLIGMTPAKPVEGSGMVDYSNQRIAVDAQQEVQRAKDALREYAEQTGGLAMVDKNDMDEAFDRIVQDNSSYYLLGYQSPDARHDGRFHRVTVKMRRPGLQVRTRQGYYAPEHGVAARKSSDPIVGLLRTPAPVGGLGMRASAAVMKGLLLKSTVHLTIEFNGKDVALKPAGQVLTNDITLEYIALDMKGAIQVNNREVVHLQLERRFHATFPQHGVRYMHEFEIAPGRYQLRVAARDALGNRSGSVFLDLEVPDVTSLPLAMSDVLVTSTSAGDTATGKSTPAFGALLPTPPVTSRTFTAAETLTVLAAFYDNAVPSHGVDLTAVVRSEAGARVFEREETRESAELNSAKGGYRWTLAVPLTGFTAGRYVLTLEARSRLGDNVLVKKDVEFHIR